MNPKALINIKVLTPIGILLFHFRRNSRSTPTNPPSSEAKTNWPSVKTESTIKVYKTLSYLIYLMQYDLRLKEVKEKAKGCEKVLIQLPAGLRTRFLEVANAVKEAGAEPVIWAGSCYGACDLPPLDYDLLIHFGHEEFK